MGRAIKSKSMRNPRHSVRLPRLALLCCVAAAQAEDWPQLLGPRRDGSYEGAALAETWPKEGPARTWEMEVGDGFAGPVVAGGKVFIFHRPGAEERLDCLEAETGKLVWSNGHKATYRDDFGFDPGPRAVPTVAGGTVFTYGADGIVSAVAVDGGKTVWRIDAKKDFASRKGFFGRACSPMVLGDLVLLAVGGEGAGMVGLDAATGKTRWKTTNDEASYSSPTLGVFGGRTNALFLVRNALVGLDPTSGKVLHRHPFAPTMSASVTGATPLVIGDMVFISASYGAGAEVVRMANGKARTMWKSDEALSNHYATSVHRKGLLFGFHGRQEEKPALVCVEWGTGITRWRVERFGAGTVALAGDRLALLLETGELVLAAADGEKHEELRRAQVLGSDTRAHPALSDGFLYARDKTKLIRLDLRK